MDSEESSLECEEATPNQKNDVIWAQNLDEVPCHERSKFLPDVLEVWGTRPACDDLIDLHVVSVETSKNAEYYRGTLLAISPSYR
jgi:hypothetical protein